MIKPIIIIFFSFFIIPVPLPPMNVQVTSATATSAMFQWQPPAGGTYDGFFVVHLGPDGLPAQDPITLSADTTTFTLDGINTNTDNVLIYSTSGQQLSVPGFPEITSKSEY